MIRVLLAASLTMLSTPALAQEGARAMRLIVPFPAGGGSDAVGRIIGPKLGARAGQQVIVDNRAGAGGSIGTESAVRATPDGHTMVLASTSEIAINPALYKLGYDTLKDLTAVNMVASAAMVIVAAPAGPGSVKDLIALAKAKPGAVNVASAGTGTITHLSGELFRSMANLTWTHVPYKGAPPALTDVAGARVEVMFSSLPAAMPLIKAGRVKAIGVSTRAREASLPDVPTVIESGLPAYDVVYWYGVFVPSGTPAAVVTALAERIAQALRQKDTITALGNQGAVPGDMKQPQFAEFVRKEHARWTGLVKSSGAQAD